MKRSTQTTRTPALALYLHLGRDIVVRDQAMNRIVSIGTLITLGSLIAGSALSAPTEPQRYPFDPACAWGRIADGRGILLRCLTQEESQRLMSPGSANVAATGKPQEKPVKDKGTAVGGSTATTATTTATTTASTKPVSEVLVAEVVSVVPDEGKLPLALKKLGQPLDRYSTCVREHGGLLADTAQVDVRFLVQELGRAEGASVEKYRGMSTEAAHCIAAVVDRRPTGTPEAPMVGAVVTIRVANKATR